MAAIQLLKEVETPGITEFPEPTGKNAYGFQYIKSTGKLVIVRMTGSTFVRIKDQSIINSADYTALVWSDKLLRFSWPSSSSLAGHLQVEIV